MEKRFIFILLIVSVFALFTVFTGLKTPTSNVVLEKGSITIKSSSCLLDKESYNICINVNWDAPENYYVKSYITGGESLADAPKFYTRDFTYCQEVDKTQVRRVANIFLHDEKDRWVKFIKGYRIECS